MAWLAVQAGSKEENVILSAIYMKMKQKCLLYHLKCISPLVIDSVTGL